MSKFSLTYIETNMTLVSGQDRFWSWWAMRLKWVLTRVKRFLLIEKGQMLTVRSSNTMYARKLTDQRSWSWIWPSKRFIKKRTQFNLLRPFTRKRFKL